MKDTPFKSGQQMTESERKRDAEGRKWADEVIFARRKAARRQTYNRPGSPAHKRNYDRMVGSE